MKKSIFLIVVFVLFGVVTHLYAQEKLSKKEKRYWKKKIKALKPSVYKEMFEEFSELKTQSFMFKNQISNLESERDEAVKKAKAKNKAIKNLEEELAQAKAEVAAMESKDGNGESNDDNLEKGVVFKVQIGAFRDSKLQKIVDQSNWAEEDSDGMRKFTIGAFRDYWTADSFKKYLRKMGVKDAWIVAYEDNVRRDIKELVENIDPKDNENE